MPTRSEKSPRKPLAKVLPLRPRAERPERPSRRRPRARALKPVPIEEVERAFGEMAARTSSALDVQQAQRALLTVIFDLVGPKACFLSSYVPARGQLQVDCVRGRNDERITAAAPGIGPVGTSFSGNQVVREDGWVCAPLRGPNGPVGCLSLVDCRFEVSDALVMALAAQVAAATEVARLRDETVRRNKDLQTAVAGLKSLEEAREDLLANVSHDLKNPLTTIKTYLSLLTRAKNGDLNERQEHALNVCERNADRLLRMINDLVLHSRLQSGNMTLNERPFGLKSVLEEVAAALRPLAEPAKVELRLNPCAEIFIRGDRERLVEALFNLVESAVYSSRPDTAVELEVGDGDSGLAQVTVVDHGHGLSGPEVSALFEGYYRVGGNGRKRRSGLGLRLPIAAKIIQLHGGRLEASSEPGVGTTFRAFLPVFAGAVQAPEQGQPPRTGGILLVEDDADCREVLQQLLEQEGYRVMATASAADARALLANIRPAMVLLDLRLSDDDGRVVLHAIRGAPALSDVPVYIISGANEVAELAAGVGDDRIDGYFEKPLQLPKLLDTIASVVRPARAPAAP